MKTDIPPDHYQISRVINYIDCDSDSEISLSLTMNNDILVQLLEEYGVERFWNAPVELPAETNERRNVCCLCGAAIPGTNVPKRNCMGYNCVETLCANCFTKNGDQMFLCCNHTQNTIIQECAYCVDYTATEISSELMKGYVGYVITNEAEGEANIFFRLYDGTSVMVDHEGKIKDRHFKVRTYHSSTGVVRKNPRWCIYEQFRRCKDEKKRNGALGMMLSKKAELGSEFKTPARKEFDLDDKASMKGKYKTNAVFNVVVHRQLKNAGRKRARTAME